MKQSNLKHQTVKGIFCINLKGIRMVVYTRSNIIHFYQLWRFSLFILTFIP